MEIETANSYGSTDVGDVPAHRSRHHDPHRYLQHRRPGHSWQITACSGMSIGEKGMNRAAQSHGCFRAEVLNDTSSTKLPKRNSTKRWPAKICMPHPRWKFRSSHQIVLIVKPGGGNPPPGFYPYMLGGLQNYPEFPICPKGFPSFPDPASGGGQCPPPLTATA